MGNKYDARDEEGDEDVSEEEQKRVYNVSKTQKMMMAKM